MLPMGIRMFALYVTAHYTYLQKDYQKSLGIVEATLGMQTEEYPIPCIYLHLVAVMDYMSLKQIDKAKQHLLAAWELAKPDDLIEGFGEHHGLLGGMLEAVIKRRRKRRKARRQARKEAKRAQKAEEKRLAAQRNGDPWRARKPKLPWEG